MGVTATEERVGTVTVTHPDLSPVVGTIGYLMIGSGTIGNPAYGARRDVTATVATGGTVTGTLEH